MRKNAWVICCCTAVLSAFGIFFRWLQDQACFEAETGLAVHGSIWPYVVALMIASDPNSGSIMGLVENAWGVFGAAFGPVIIMSLWWRRMTRNGALAGMITGAVTVLVWNHYAWLGLYEILPGFVFALIAIVVVSLLDKAPSKSIAKTFDEVQAAVRNPA